MKKIIEDLKEMTKTGSPYVIIGFICFGYTLGDITKYIISLF